MHQATKLLTIDKFFVLNYNLSMETNKKEKIIKVIKRGEEERPLKNDFDVLVKIYELTVVKNSFACFKNLKEEIDACPEAISINLDKLFDLCLIDGKWEQKNVEGKPQWTRCFYVDKSFLPYAKCLYNLRKTVEQEQKIEDEEKTKRL